MPHRLALAAASYETKFARQYRLRSALLRARRDSHPRRKAPLPLAAIKKKPREQMRAPPYIGPINLLSRRRAHPSSSPAARPARSRFSYRRSAEVEAPRLAPHDIARGDAAWQRDLQKKRAAAAVQRGLLGSASLTNAPRRPALHCVSRARASRKSGRQVFCAAAARAALTDWCARTALRGRNVRKGAG